MVDNKILKITTDTYNNLPDEVKNNLQQIAEKYTNSAFDVKENTAVVSSDSDIDVAKTMGFEKSKRTKRQAKAWRNDFMSEYILKQVGSFKTDGDWDKFKNNIEQQLKNTHVLDPEYYTQMQAQLNTVIDIMKNYKYSSRQDIVQIQNKAKKELDKIGNDENNEFRSDILKVCVGMIEARQMEIENSVIFSKFIELRNEGKTRKECLDALQKDPEIKGSYYHDYNGLSAYENISERYDSGYLHKGLIHQFEDSEMLDEAENEVWDAINSLKIGSKGLTTSREIEKAAIEILKKNNSYDKYTKTILRGQLSFMQKMHWDMSLVKGFRKSVAAYNRSELRKEGAYTVNDFMDTTKDNSVVAKLAAKNLIAESGKNEKGETTYNITELSNMIRKRIGDDLKANGQKKDYNVYSEIKNIAIDLDISEKDAKNLVKFCGYDIDSKNWAQVFYDAFVGTAISGVSALAGMGITDPTASAVFTGATSGIATFDYNKTFPVQVNVSDKEHMEFTLNYDSGVKFNKFQFLKDLYASSGLTADQVKIETTQNSIKIIINKSDEYSIQAFKTIQERLSKVVTLEELGIDPNQYEADAKFDIASALGKTMLLAFALNFLQAALKEQKGELPVITTQFDKDTKLEDYLAKLEQNDKLSPSMKRGFADLAMTFVEMKDGKPVEGGKWNSEGYRQLLNKIAGDESMLNKYEAANALYNLRQSLHGERNTAVQESKTPTPVITAPPKEAPKVEVLNGKLPEAEQADSKKDKEPEWEATKSKIIPSTKFRHWDDLVNGYSCLSRPEFQKRYKVGNQSVTVANRMVKVIQAMDVSGVKSSEELKTFYDIDKIKEFAEDTLKLGSFKKALEKHPDFPINEKEFNDVLRSSAGVNGQVYTPYVYDNEDGICGWEEPKSKTPIVHGKDGTAAKIDNKNGEVHYYKRQVGTTKWQPCTESEYNNIKTKK